MLRAFIVLRSVWFVRRRAHQEFAGWNDDHFRRKRRILEYRADGQMPVDA